MRDPRLDEYARLLVERSVAVQAGWQVVIRATPSARPLIEAIVEQVARLGAYPLMLLSFEQVGARSRARRRSTCCACRRRCRGTSGKRWTR